jgi:hypothetical protein
MNGDSGCSVLALLFGSPTPQGIRRIDLQSLLDGAVLASFTRSGVIYDECGSSVPLRESTTQHHRDRPAHNPPFRHVNQAANLVRFFIKNLRKHACQWLFTLVEQTLSP